MLQEIHESNVQLKGIGELTSKNNDLKAKLEIVKNKKEGDKKVFSAEKENLENKLSKQSKVVADQAQKNQENINKITVLKSQNAELLAQLEKLKVRTETKEVGEQTNEVTISDLKSVGTETEKAMDRSMLPQEATINTTKVIVPEQAISPLIEGQVIDKILTHDDKVL